MIQPSAIEAMASEIIEKLRGLAELSGLDRREHARLFGIAACEACWRCLSPDRQRDSPLGPGICPHDLPGWSRSWAKTFLAAIERVTPEAYAQAFFLARAAQQAVGDLPTDERAEIEAEIDQILGIPLAQVASFEYWIVIVQRRVPMMRGG